MLNMPEIIKESILDTLKLIPFIFIAFLIIELIEHKLTNKNKKILSKSKKYGVILGSLLGVIPQCGFSVMATNLYITKIISLGTLISIYLSTSDEMLPILLSHKVSPNIIITILLIKVLFAIVYGILIDIILSKKKNNTKENYQICEEEHCDCKHGILKSSIKHTISITLFILFANFAITTIFTYIGEDFLSKIFLKDTIFGPIVTSLIGLIPNCGASVILTELYLNNAINLPSLISGLLTGSGTPIIVLFKRNQKIKETIFILVLLYILGTISGIIIESISLLL